MNLDNGAVTMNWVPSTPATNPTTVFANPPIPITPLESAS
jgi:hypothetical protein